MRRRKRRWKLEDCPGGPVVKNLPAKEGDMKIPLICEDPTCDRATKPVYHNYRSLCTVTREVTAMRSPCTTVQSSLRALQLEKKTSTSNNNNK